MIPVIHVSTLPKQIEENIRKNDPPKQELYDLYHLPHSAKPVISVSVESVSDQRKSLSGVEGWVYIKGTW